jgi:hypothetical protein
LIKILLLFLLRWVVAGWGHQRQRQFRQEKRQFAIVMNSKVKQMERRTAQLYAGMLAGDSLTVEVDTLKRRQGELRAELTSIDEADPAVWKELRPAMESRYYDLERHYYEIASVTAAREAAAAATDSLEVNVTKDNTAQARPSFVTPASAASPDTSSAMLQGN